LRNISKNWRLKREEKGSLKLNSLEFKFELAPETMQPTGNFIKYESLETNYLVEEMMLKANELAAETTLKNCPSCAILRRHPPPKFHALEELNNELQKINEKLD
jgi:exosome complex exonuclease DIS3/RRP44